MARHWAAEKTLHDLAEVGMISFFEGSGTNPMALSGASTAKIWLQTESGVTDTSGTFRRYDGTGDASDIANWSVMTPSGYLLHLGGLTPSSSVADYATVAAVEAATISGAVTYLRTAGYRTVGDGGGALYISVGSEPSHDGKIQSDDGTWWELVDPNPTVEMFGAHFDNTTDDQPAFAAAHTYLVARNGGTIRCANNYYAIANTIEITEENIRIEGLGGDYLHDAGNSVDAGTKFKWTGSAGGTMVHVYTPATVTRSKNTGGGMVGVELDGNVSAATGLKLTSVNRGIFEDLHVQGCTANCYLVTNYNSGTLAEAEDSQFNTFTRCTYRAIAVGTQSANGFKLTSNTPTLAGANTSFNTFTSCDGQVHTGRGWLLEDADNNLIIQARVYRVTTTNPGIECRNAVSDANIFIQVSVSGGTSNCIAVRGAASGYTGNPTQNIFIGIDSLNGTQPPTFDASCYGIVIMASGQIRGLHAFGMGFGGDNSTTNRARDAVLAAGNIPAYFDTGVGPGPLFSDGTNTWEVTNASTDLRIRQTAGSTGKLVVFEAIRTNTGFLVSGNTVVGARKTGWTAASGTATRTTFDTATVTLPQLAERVKALIDDLHQTAGHGLIGT
jgi:hypothetical protein